ncbi:hypothetical protein B7P43_G11742 [Cryptotermes secundus]|uniref:Uncharacterized protein n=1 Tax=Cryptotermes secundus TaxID=105785 RepID=A0A2J7QB38_9NEOP|nr:hypothetical protein B7P43_G11742 [Cryptotermes secundus]
MSGKQAVELCKSSTVLGRMYTVELCVVYALAVCSRERKAGLHNPIRDARVI